MVEQEGWSRKELARRMNEPYKNVQRRLTGESEHLPADFVARFAEETGYRVEWLMLGAEPRKEMGVAVAELSWRLHERVIDLARDPSVSSRDLEEMLHMALGLLQQPDEDQ